MCTLALYFQEFYEFPLIVAANRDECFDRPSTSPQMLIEKPRIFGGKDLLAGGTWLGINEYGLLAGILNLTTDSKRGGTTVRSRGLLCLDTLKAKDPARACTILLREEGSSYQPFTLLFANAEKAYIVQNIKADIQCTELQRGVHVLGNTSQYEPRSEKMDHAQNLFSQAGKRAREAMDLSSMKRLFKEVLINHELPEESKNSHSAICVHAGDYGTVCSSMIFYSRLEKRFHYYHTSTPPCRSDYEEFPTVEAK